MIVLICFQNSDGAIGNSIGVSFILLHFLVHNWNSKTNLVKLIMIFKTWL